MMTRILSICLLAVVLSGAANTASSQEMDEMWGESVVKLRAENARRGQLFDEGNYAMFIHWGVYSQLANKVDGKTYYGIGEWIMNKRMAGIPVDEYKRLAGTFNPVNFDAKAIARLAKNAGMKYIVITSKHHDGFAMYHSKACDFNIVDATPWNKDPMKELAAACRDAGLGFGFYYSHNQDWTFPGGGNGPKTDADGNRATFDDYFVKKCLPQVKEITSEYGPIEVVWFDTPGRMPKHYVEEVKISIHLSKTEFNECDRNPLPNVPVYFIMAGGYSAGEGDNSPLDCDREKLFRVNENLKMKRYLQLLYPLKYGKLFYSSGSSHYVQTDEPDLVISCIKLVQIDYEKIQSENKTSL